MQQCSDPCHKHQIMLFDYDKDFHMMENLAVKKPEIVEHGLKLLHNWYNEIQENHPFNEDPMQTVLREGGPFHTRDQLGRYIKRLQESGREDADRRLRP